MNYLKTTLLSYRERFKRLDRKWHVLIGAQLLFGLAAFRFQRHQRRLEEQQQQNQIQDLVSSNSNNNDNDNDKP